MQNGSTFKAILPGLSVEVEFYSRFFFREKRENPTFLYWRLHKRTAVSIMQTQNDLSLSQNFYVSLMVFKQSDSAGINRKY